MRHGREGVDEAHDHPVAPAAEGSGDRADRRADEGGGERRDHSHQQRDPQPVHAAEQQVAAHVIGSERVGPGRWLELARQVHGLFVQLDDGRDEEARRARGRPTITAEVRTRGARVERRGCSCECRGTSAIETHPGSASPYSRSERRLPSSTAAVASTVRAASSGKSTEVAACTVAAAMPGQLNTVSTRSAPVISSGTRDPISVSMGSMPDRRAWPVSTVRSARPRARAPRTGSCARASPTPWRTYRKNQGSWDRPSTAAGSTRWLRICPKVTVSLAVSVSPPAGSTPSFRAKNQMASSPSQKTGAASRVYAAELTQRSSRPPRPRGEHPEGRAEQDREQEGGGGQEHGPADAFGDDVGDGLAQHAGVAEVAGEGRGQPVPPALHQRLVDAEVGA